MGKHGRGKGAQLHILFPSCNVPSSAHWRGMRGQLRPLHCLPELSWSSPAAYMTDTDAARWQCMVVWPIVPLHATDCGCAQLYSHVPNGHNNCIVHQLPHTRA